MAWNDVIGHELAKRIWQSHLATGRVANAYLLAGRAGIGKRRLAFEMAKALNCTGAEPHPCDACSACRSIARGTHPDVHYLVPEGSSDEIRIDEMRSLIGRVALRPFNAKRQVAILDRVERLTEEAANSLLKVLEEPPGATTFLLLTSQASSCLPTILSRCQLIRCQPLSIGTLAQLLTRQAACEGPRAQAIARMSGGSAARALALAKQGEREQAQVGELSAEHWMERPLPETRQEVGEWIEALLHWLRDVAFVVALDGDARHVIHREAAEALRRQARQIDAEHCVEAAFEFLQLRESLDHFANPRLVAALVRERWLNVHGVRREG